MTTLSPTEFTLVVRREPTTSTVHVRGELDYDTSDEPVGAITENLTDEQTPPRAVHQDFSELTWIDSSGLSALPTVHRRTSTLGTTLHLDNRPDVLERVLRLTNVLDHLTGPGLQEATRPLAAPPA